MSMFFILSLASLIFLQHVTHLKALLDENKSLSTKDLHDSGVRTLCICEPGQVDLDKVHLWKLFPYASCQGNSEEIDVNRSML